MTEHRLLRTDEEVLKYAETVARASDRHVVAHDTETAGSPEAMAVFGADAALYPYAGSYCTGISVCLYDESDLDYFGATGEQNHSLVGVYVPVGHKRGNASPRAVKALCEALGRTQAVHELHHANFDWEVLENLDKGYKPGGGSGRTIDTQVVRWLDDENQPKGLKTIGEIYLGEDAGEEKRVLHGALKPNLPEGWKQTETYRHIRAEFPEIPVAEARAMARRLRTSRTWGDITVEEMFPYASRDATLTAEVGALFLDYEELLCPPGPLQREMDIQPILHGMTKQGVGVDIDGLRAAGADYLARADKIEAQYEEAFGFDLRRRFGPKTKMNLGSTDQVSWLLYEHEGLKVRVRTNSGAPSTAKAALEMMEGHKTVAGVLEARRWKKASSGYCIPFARFAEMSPDGRIHGHYSSVRTVTGRLAASGPNVMTIPREDTLPELRACFSTCKPGFTRVGYDLASAELWVTASMTKDPKLTETLLQGGSMHIDMMLEVFGGEPDKHRPEYTIAKNVNYSMAYEAGLGPLMMYAAKGGYGPEEVERIARRLLRGHKRLYARQHYVSEFLTEKARELGKLPLHVPGRYRHFKSPGVLVQYYTALNALVQGGIGEFMKDTMLELVRRGSGFAENLVLQVHDELVFDIPDKPGVAEALHAELTTISEEINPFKYVLTWEGKQWAQSEAA